MATEHTKLASMLKQDEVIYRNLVKTKAMIQESRKKIAAWRAGDRTFFKSISEGNTFITSKFNPVVESFNTSLGSYLKRQTALRSPVQGIATNLLNYATEAKDSVVTWFKNLWNSNNNDGVNGLGVLPLILVPLIIKGSVFIISIGLVTYFVNSYFEKTVVDYDASQRNVIEAYKLDPKFGKSMLDAANKVQADQNKGGFFSQLGTGAKWGIAFFGGTALTYGGYKLAVKQGWIKPIKSK